VRARRLAYDGAIYGRSEFTVMRYPRNGSNPAR